MPAGLPSELLERRPDIREAEQTLAAATANIGEAKAMLFPRIALTGSFGTASTDFDTLFEGPSKSWNIIGNLLQPIFNAGKNKRRVEITESRQRQMLYAYERTILQAFRETEDSLMAYRKTGEQRQAQTDRVAAERKVLELCELRYKGGVSAYLEVLDAQRSLFDAELDEASTIGSHLTSLVRALQGAGRRLAGVAGSHYRRSTPSTPSTREALIVVRLRFRGSGEASAWAPLPAAGSRIVHKHLDEVLRRHEVLVRPRQDVEAKLVKAEAKRNCDHVGFAQEGTGGVVHPLV